jgi:hypothetical protein
MSFDQGCHIGRLSGKSRRPDASGIPSVRMNIRVGRPLADGTSGRPVGRPSGRHLVDGHRTTCRPPLHPADGMADGHPTASHPLRPSVGWRMAAPSAGRPPEAVHQGPSAQSKLWRPITIDLEVRLRCVIPFWSVQVMLYNIGY